MKNNILSIVIFCTFPSLSFGQNNAQISGKALIDRNIYAPDGLVVVDDYLFLKDYIEATGDYGIRMYNRHTGDKIKEFLTAGKGPGEYLNFNIMRGPQPSTLEISDRTNRKNDVYSVPCILELAENKALSSCIKQSVPNFTTVEAMIVDENMVLNSTPYVEGVNFLSEGDKVINVVTTVPTEIAALYENDYTASIAMGGYLVSNSNRSRFAYFGRYFDQSTFFSYKDGVFEEYKSNRYSYLPKIDVVEFGGSNRYIEPSKDAKFAAVSVASDAQSTIYMLYSGQTLADVTESDVVEMRALSKKIKVFSWEGFETSELTVGESLGHVAVNEDGTYLYGVAVTNPELLEFKIMAYKLK